MKYVGVRNEQVPLKCSLKQAADTLSVDEITMLGLIRLGHVMATAVGDSYVILAEDLLFFMECQRNATSERSILSLAAFEACIPILVEWLEATPVQMDEALDELEYEHHFTPAKDPYSDDWIIFVNRGQAKKPLSRTIKRLLSHAGPERCPFCEAIIPTTLRRARDEEAPRPKWTSFASRLIEEAPSINLTGWKIRCPKCDKEAKFVYAHSSTTFGAD